MNNFIRFNNLIVNQDHIICMVHDPENDKLTIYLIGDINYNFNLSKINANESLINILNELNK